jgi:hypothetical protein
VNPSSTQPDPPSEPPSGRRARERRDMRSANRFLWGGKMRQAFWDLAGLSSLVVNVVLIVILVLLAKEVFSLKRLVQDQLIGGLHSNFVKMDEAHIVTTILVSDTIQVNDTIPVVFDLPLKQDTQIKLTRDTEVKNATIFLNGKAVPLNIILKEGTPLNISLDLVVPVNQMVPIQLKVPVNLTVPVDIPLSKTDLHQPFVGLQNVLGPYQSLLAKYPNSWKQTPLCGKLTNWLCGAFFGPQ